MIEMSFDIHPDEFGVFDGRTLARKMIERAYRCLIPYVDACPACCDALFSALANTVIEDVHREREEIGQLQGCLLSIVADEEAREGAEAQHLAHSVDYTELLLCSDHVH